MRTGSVPESIQAAIVGGSLLFFLAALSLHLAPVSILIAGTLAGSVALFVTARCIPSLHSSLAVHEHGLEVVVHGESTVFTYDEVSCIAAKLTHHLLNHQYVGTRVRLEFSIDGRFRPCVYDGEFRRNGWKERLVMAAMERCSRAIQERLLAELESNGALRWRDNVSLTPEGIVLTDSDTASRIIPYAEISDWKIDDNDLKIWKADDALPFLMMGNDTSNFVPLFGLFESLCNAARSTALNQQVEPALA